MDSDMDFDEVAELFSLAMEFWSRGEDVPADVKAKLRTLSHDERHRVMDRMFFMVLE